jgi:DNA modification methylase
VLDPFSGSGSVGVVALKHGRRYIGIDLNPEYIQMARRRIEGSLYADNVIDSPRVRVIEGQHALFPELVGKQ